MGYWWVNHKQTFLEEIEGGYIWSPKENRNGSKNQTYINLTMTKPGDIVFSYASGMIQAIGIVSSYHREQNKPSEFDKIGNSWAPLGWAVPIEWQLLKEPIKPKEYIDKIRDLLPERNSPIQINGNGNQGCYLASISDDLGKLLINFSKKNNFEVLFSIENERLEVKELELEYFFKKQDIDPTEIDQLIKARRGQGKFRLNVEKIENSCRVTGLTRKDLLIASHIKPWRNSNNLERLDGNNGLLLSPHIDKLFDNGWITFNQEGNLIVSNNEIEEVLLSWGVFLPKNVGIFNINQANYLVYHYQFVFKQTA